MIVSKLSDLPAEYTCNSCGDTKPVIEMCVVRRRDRKGFYLAPRCKECHNTGERGHRRDYKTKYLQRWRAKNAELNKSYRDTDTHREKAAIRQYAQFTAHHEAMLIQGRMRFRGVKVSLKEAQGLLERFGRCYPTRFGLTEAGLRECERIRSKQRRPGTKFRLSAFEIRIMVYEDGLERTELNERLFISPDKQPVPYQSRAEQLRKWHAERRSKKTITVSAGVLASDNSSYVVLRSTASG